MLGLYGTGCGDTWQRSGGFNLYDEKLTILSLPRLHHHPEGWLQNMQPTKSSEQQHNRKLETF